MGDEGAPPQREGHHGPGPDQEDPAEMAAWWCSPGRWPAPPRRPPQVRKERVSGSGREETGQGGGPRAG